MTRPLKLAITLVLSLSIVVISAYLYVSRDQQLQMENFPLEFEHCGKAISKGDGKYDELFNVLIRNQENWESSLVSYVPARMYYSPNFQINVLEELVVVSYQNNTEYEQLVKSINYDWSNSCNKEPNFSFQR